MADSKMTSSEVVLPDENNEYATDEVSIEGTEGEQESWV